MHALLLHYDEYHTPIAEFQARSGVAAGHWAVLAVDLGDVAPVPSPPEIPSAPVIRVNGIERLCEEQLPALIHANGTYQQGYHLSAAVTRPLLARICVEQARRIGARRVVHGFAGNDALRFVAGVRSLAPELDVDSFGRVCGSRTRANAQGYTVSRSLAGLSIEAGPLEDESHVSALESLARRLGVPPPQAAVAPQRHRIEFVDGLPVSLDGEARTLPELLAELNRIGIRHGVGWIDMVEDGHVGYKTRALYFTPGLTALVLAHRDLERTLLSPALNELKEKLDADWARLQYRGFGLDAATRALNAFMREAAHGVSGEVWLEYGASALRVAARRARRRVDSSALAVYRAGQDFGLALIDELAVLQAWPAQHAMKAEGAR